MNAPARLIAARADAPARLRTARTDAARLAALLSSEQAAMADFLLALAAFDASRGWAELGHASLFAFLVRQLHLSKSAAYHRAAGARLARVFPAVADALRDGRLCLSSVAELAKVLSAENEAAVLPRFFGLSAREARELVAELVPHPSPPQREVVRRVVEAPASREPTEPASGATFERAGQAPGGLGSQSAHDLPRQAPSNLGSQAPGDLSHQAPRDLAGAPAIPRRSAIPSTSEVVLTSEPAARTEVGAEFRVEGASPAMAATSTETNLSGSLRSMAPSAAPGRRPDEVVPLDADLRRLHVTVSRGFLQKLEAARSVRAHARPGATTEAILEEALDLLLAREAKRREGVRREPGEARDSATKLDGGTVPEGRGVPDSGGLPDGGTAPACGAVPEVDGEPGPAAHADAPRHRLPPDLRREHVPAQVRREVWARDAGRCQWPLDGGGTCGSTHRVQLDHVDPAARGGPPTAANLRILCEAHNKEAARRSFGARWLARRGGGSPADAA